MSLNLTAAREFVSKEFEEKAIPTLCDYIRIDNQSPAFDNEWATNGKMDKAIDLLFNWVKAQNVPGLHAEVVKLENRTPLMFFTLEGKNSTQTVLMYGHMDKQPPCEPWAEGLHPYTPVIKDGKLFGRGGADDGYATFSSILAIKAVLEQGLDHPRIVIMVEAREESGSQDLQAYVEHLSDKIGTPSLVVCLDSGCGNYEQFWMTTALRGCIMGALHVKILKDGVHSGQGSGIVPSSFRIIRMLLNRIEDAETGQVLVPELNPPIPQERIDQQRECAEILGDGIIHEFPFVEGAGPVTNDLHQLLLNRNWRATVSYTGADGMPPVATGGNVLRTHTVLKLSVRLPPHVNPQVGAEALKKALERDPPYGAHVKFEVSAAMGGWASPLLSPWLEKAIRDAGLEVFGKKHAFTAEGGTIPFMGMLGEKFPKAQFVITGILGPNSNAHGPNEFLHIDMTKNVTTVVAHILAEQAKQK